uniref:Uncharacterized protein n=1 Tax=Arundo donax TaxID=35708 RepID=A0A0A8YJJ0_ARUDO
MFWRGERLVGTSRETLAYLGIPRSKKHSRVCRGTVSRMISTLHR